MSIDSTGLRQILRQFADVIANKADQDPTFAEELANLIEVSSSIAKPQSKSTKKKSIQVENVLDPFNLFMSQGIDELRESLKSLDIEQLRMIVRKHQFDPARASTKWKEEQHKDRFINLIADRVEARCKQGDAFRQYGSQIHDS